MDQLTLPLARPRWGGARPGAGRKPGSRRTVPHRTRPKHSRHCPVHVTLRARGGLPSFREQALFGAMRRAIREGARFGTFRVTQFSVQSNHVHLVVEASDRVLLSRGMQGLAVRLARAVNDLLDVRGHVWRERFHARELRTPTEVRNALVYVLMNARKHGERLRGGVDRFSSAPWFDGFASRLVASLEDCPVLAARTWLGGTGWRRRGLVRLDERPRAPS